MLGQKLTHPGMNKIEVVKGIEISQDKENSYLIEMKISPEDTVSSRLIRAPDYVSIDFLSNVIKQVISVIGLQQVYANPPKFMSSVMSSLEYTERLKNGENILDIRVNTTELDTCVKYGICLGISEQQTISHMKEGARWAKTEYGNFFLKSTAELMSIKLK
ncbi:MAG: hypothetical protein QXT45_05800 [Candidatus Bilamarchaeaceae archaeon]